MRGIIWRLPWGTTKRKIFLACHANENAFHFNKTYDLDNLPVKRSFDVFYKSRHLKLTNFGHASVHSWSRLWSWAFNHNPICPGWGLSPTCWTNADTGNLFYCFDLLRNEDNEKNERGAANCTQPKLLSAPSQSKVSFNDSSKIKENWTQMNPLPLSTAQMNCNEGAKR